MSRPSAFLRGSSSKELLLDNQAQEEQRREMLETVKQLTGGLESDRSSSSSTEADRSKVKEVGESPTEWAGQPAAGGLRSPEGRLQSVEAPAGEQDGCRVPYASLGVEPDRARD